MKIACALVLVMVGTTVAYADSLITLRPAGTDTVNWSQLGSPSTPIPQNFTFTTANLVSGAGHFANGSGLLSQQPYSWGGNFSPGDYVVYTNGNGPLLLTFASGYTQIGAQIQANFDGAFTAQICDINGCFTETGNANGANDGSAIYIGISSASPINLVTFGLTSSNGPQGQFAINDVTMNASPVPSPVPEPSSLALLSTGLVGAWGAMRRRVYRA